MNDTIYAALVELVDAATSDRELTLIAAAATAVAAPQLAADLRDVRDQMRAAVRPKTMTDEELIVQSVLDLGVAELITHSTRDEQIAGLVIAAEAGAGGPLPGLHAELIRLRDAEHVEWRAQVDAAKAKLRAQADFTRIDPGDPFAPTALRENDRARRVFVAGAFGDPIRVHVPDPAPRISNLGEDFEDAVEPGEAGCRFAYGNRVPDPATVAPRIANVHESAAERRRIDEIKATISVGDL
ncbi:hypothetical protein [Mycobacteroides abscessus]|uniref:hypothetical protein n=1 Tax=Mycobacteroides abscessus TaxID=36809 RepID=UPI00092ACD80|nr:hypothetical protein [Mycobacteroides abscessus]SIF25575.1 Uncharacterised protein [Mycobacteroides abscessus subsp. abscessus]SIF38796.1 Uncharacterised protein [Mycobacteroides abscessus subsp. abscessus]SIF83585.1 Uncharacterised protein [Mycobacteroides abscessus subsp. abscessus]